MIFAHILFDLIVKLTAKSEFVRNVKITKINVKKIRFAHFRAFKNCLKSKFGIKVSTSIRSLNGSLLISKDASHNVNIAVISLQDFQPEVQTSKAQS